MRFLTTPRADQTTTGRRVAEHLLSDEDDDDAMRAWLTDTMLRPGQVAALFQVSRQCVAKWARAGLLTWIETPGGHRRFRADEVAELARTTLKRRLPPGATTEGTPAGTTFDPR